MPNKEVPEAVKAFVKAGRKWKRAYDSKNNQYWLKHEDESASGWTYKRLYPYRKAAEQAAERVDALFDEAYDIWDNASPEDKAAIEEADIWYIVTC